MAGIHPLSRTQQFDKSTGRFLIGGKLYLFQAGSATPIDAFQDYGLSAKYPWPITLDSAGRIPMIYLNEQNFKHRLTDARGVIQFQDDSIPTTGPSAGGANPGSTVDPTSTFMTRDLKFRYDDQPIPGYVRLNGRTIGSAISGATERANSDTQSLFEEMWQFWNATVIGGKGASAHADWLANKALVLPDAAGRLFGAVTNMGNGIKTTITSETIANADKVGATGGVESVALTTGQIPSHSHQATVNDPGHSHSLSWSTLLGNAAGIIGGLAQGNGVTGFIQVIANAVSTGISVAIGNNGGGERHTNMPPSFLAMIYIKL